MLLLDMIICNLLIYETSIMKALACCESLLYQSGFITTRFKCTVFPFHKDSRGKVIGYLHMKNVTVAVLTFPVTPIGDFHNDIIYKFK